MGKNYKWTLLAMLSLAFFFHQADRVLFGLLTIPIQEELGLNDLQIGWINTSLFCTLAVMTPIAGFLGDRFSRKWIITCSLLFWSLMTALTGFVGGMLGLIFLRSIATGGGESFYAPSAYALLASYHKRTRSIALSVHQAALYVGLMTSGALVAWVLHKLKAWPFIAQCFGKLGYWRPVFLVFGGLGFLLGVLFIFKLRDAPGDGSAPAAESANGAGESVLGGILRTFREIGCAVKVYATTPSALFAMSGFVAVVFANNAYLSWAPKFMARKFGLGIGEAGNGTMLYHHLCAFVAILIGGILTDHFVRRWPRFRLVLQASALFLGAPALALIGISGTLTATWLAVGAYGVFRGLFEVNTHASMFDVIEPKYRSTAVGLMTMAAFFIGSLSPLLIGVLSNRYAVEGLTKAGVDAADFAAVLANPAAEAVAPVLERAHLTVEQVNQLGLPGFEIGFTCMAVAYLVGSSLILCSILFTFNKDRISE